MTDSHCDRSAMVFANSVYEASFDNMSVLKSSGLSIGPSKRSKEVADADGNGAGSVWDWRVSSNGGEFVRANVDKIEFPIVASLIGGSAMLGSV